MFYQSTAQVNPGQVFFMCLTQLSREGRAMFSTQNANYLAVEFPIQAIFLHSLDNFFLLS